MCVCLTVTAAMPRAWPCRTCGSPGRNRSWTTGTGARTPAAGKVYVDALNSGGAFEVPAGSRIDIGGHSYLVAECRRCEDFNGHVHHWELVVR